MEVVPVGTVGRLLWFTSGHITSEPATGGYAMPGNSSETETSTI